MLKKRVLVGAAVSTIVGVAAVVWCVTRPTPYHAAYDSITIGMTRDQVERLVPLLPADHPAPEGADIAVARFADAAGRVRVCGDSAFNAEPAISGSRYNTWPGDAHLDMADDGVVVYSDRTTRAVLGKERRWLVRGEELTVVFDRSDRVVEKLHIMYAVGPDLGRRTGLLRRFLGWLGLAVDDRVVRS
jgi:hypothetical protein